MYKSQLLWRLHFFTCITYCSFFLYSWITRSSFWKICRSLLYATLCLAFAMYTSWDASFTASAKGISMPKWKLVFGLHHSVLANRQLPSLPSLSWKHHVSRCPFYLYWNRVCSVLSFLPVLSVYTFSFHHSHSLSLFFRSPKQYKMPRIGSSDPSEFTSCEKEYSRVVQCFWTKPLLVCVMGYSITHMNLGARPIKQNNLHCSISNRSMQVHRIRLKILNWAANSELLKALSIH